MGLKLNGRYISLILAVQIGKWTAKFGIKLCAPKPGRCMQKRNVELSGADGRGLGRRRDPPLPAPRSRRLLPGGIFAVLRAGKAGGSRRTGSRFLIPLNSLLVLVFRNQCMLVQTSLLPPWSSSFFPRPFSPSPRTTAFVSAFRMSPAFLSTDNLGTSALRNPYTHPLPEGQRNKNRHKMACERSSWKVFFAEN